MIISAVEYFRDKEEVSGSIPLSSTKYAAVAPMVEQRIENSCVTGSSPVCGTKLAVVQWIVQGTPNAWIQVRFLAAGPTT